MKEVYQFFTRPNVLYVLLPFLWGAIWAAALQWTRLGRFLALKRTWLTVLIGVGGDLLFMLAFLNIEDWFRTLIILAASSIPIIFRSLANERADLREGIDDERTRQSSGP